MDWGAWWAAVHGVTKSQTRLSNFTFTFHFHALEKEMATHSSVLAWRIPRMGEPGGLPSVGSHRVGHDWSALAAAAASFQCVFVLKDPFPTRSRIGISLEIFLVGNGHMASVGSLGWREGILFHGWAKCSFFCCFLFFSEGAYWKEAGCG